MGFELCVCGSGRESCHTISGRGLLSRPRTPKRIASFSALLPRAHSSRPARHLSRHLSLRALQTFLHKSRHDHAMRRVRGPGGRFLTKAELDQYRKQLEAQDPEGATAPAPLPGTGKKNQVREVLLDGGVGIIEQARRDLLSSF